MDSLDKFLPSAVDSSIIDKLYEETPIVTELTLEDFLQLPVNEEYKKNALQLTQERFRIDKNIITNKNAKIISHTTDILDV